MGGYEKQLLKTQRDADHTYYEARIAEAVREQKDLLEKAVELIKTWHNGEAVLKLGEEQAEFMWNVYYNNAPEMKAIRQALENKEGNDGK